MLERSFQTNSRRRAHHLLLFVVPLAVTALGATVGMAQEIRRFEEPLAITQASAPYSAFPPDVDYDVTLDGDLTGVAPKQALSISLDAGNFASAQALANGDGAHGFSAEATAIRSPWSDRPPYARAATALLFKVDGEFGEERVKAVLEFSAAMTAGNEGPRGEASSAAFWIEVGQWYSPGELRFDGLEFKLAKYPSLRIPALIGAAGFHQRMSGRDESRVNLYANGVAIEDRPGSGPIKYTKRIKMNLPAGVPYVAYIGVGSAGSAAAYLDPVILPDEDNPGARITLYAAHDPTSPGPSFPSAERLTAAGIDVGPLREMGVLDPPEPACTGGTALARGKLAIEQVATVNSRLRLRGELALRPLPLDPEFDPIARGLRVRVEDVDGQAIIDDIVPGGAFDPATRIGWRHQPAHDRWVYTHPGRLGVRRLVVKHLPGADETYRFTASAYLPESPVPSGESLPLTATIVVDAPVARDGQCGSVVFDDASPGAQCPVLEDARLVCRRGGAAGGG